MEYPDPVLRAKNKRIETFDDNLKKLVSEMFDVMYKYVFIVLFDKVQCFVIVLQEGKKMLNCPCYTSVES